MPSSFDLARRRGLAALAGAALWLVGCATPAPAVAPAPVRAALAPTGKLRVGVYPGSPSSMVVDASGRTVGVAYELGREMARRLDVPFEPVLYRRLADVVDALKAGQVDFTFTNASPARARDIDFTATLLDVELGYLAPAGGRLSSIADVDQPGVRVGVSEGSSSQATLSRQYRHAQLAPVPTLKAASEALAQGRLDVFATNKGILSELADGLPGARLLAGRWGLEHMAIGVPKGRAAGLPWLNEFALGVQRDGTLQAAIARAGLRGSVAPANP